MVKSDSDSESRLFDMPEPTYWESELYDKAYFKGIEDTQYRYYDDSNVFRYLFYHWVGRWAYALSKQYIEPYKYHPLPVRDQVLRWQPIFSKHISDGLVRLERYQLAKSVSKKAKAKKPYRSILFRALVLTVWKRALLLSLCLVGTNVLSMSIAILVKKLLEILNNKSFTFINTLLLLLAIIVCQIADGLFLENINFYILRLICIIHYLLSITAFQHGLSYRRNYSNNVNGSNYLQVCNQILHRCSSDSECSKNPLYCQARRHQNREIDPRMYSFEWNDSYYSSETFESLKYIIEFTTNFVYGIILISHQIKTNLWLLYVVGICFLILMVIVELLNAFVYGSILHLRDIKVDKCNDIIPSLYLIKKIFYDDIAINIMTQARNNEISLFFIRLFLNLFNTSLYTICVNLSFFIIKAYFVKSVNNASVVTDIDTAGFMTTFYIFLRIITSMFLVPTSIKVFGMSYVSFRRLDKYIRDCSPNFYITDNKFTGSTKVFTDIVDTTTQIPKDSVVYYHKATFTWVYSREDLLNHKFEPYLKHINFELKRGNMAIVTGAQGSGKSNFIKSMLGEMTLVGGSMAVVPLYTSMPIFYASQDIWLQHGTVRSNITFGYRFDEDTYNTVIKAVDLDYDISTWEKGDMRVVSDNAPSLSGGQRVRMEMARAVYAYLIFHKVNQQYNNSRCSFLMLLDCPFHGLDPYVSKTIFNNLFNVKTGLLIKEDLSIVLTSSKQTLGTCLKSSNLKQIPNPPIYNIKNETLRFYSNLHDFINENVEFTDPEEFSYLSANTNQPHQVSYLTQDMVSLCSSGSNTRLGRIEVTKKKYTKCFYSFAVEEFGGMKLSGYMVYLRPALGWFVLFLLVTGSFTVLDNLKLIFASNLSDYITKAIDNYNSGIGVDLTKIKDRSNFSFKLTSFVVIAIIALSLLSAFLFSISGILSSRKINEYIYNSIFKNTSAVIKIKKQVSQVLTCVSCDVFAIDDELGYFLSLCFIYSIQTLINVFTLFYLIPLTIPLVLCSMTLVCFCVLRRHIKSSRYIHLAYIEAVSHLISTYEKSIVGSSIHRSFKRESDFVGAVMEDRDYKARCKCLLFSVASWSSVLFNWIFSLTTLSVLTILIILDKYTKFKLKVGYFSLALSVSMNIIKSFDKFAILYSKLEVAVCSAFRFQYFVPPGQKLKFDKCINTHEEYIVNPNNRTITDAHRKQLLKRRAVEFKSDNRRFYHLRRMFYHPKITILDVGRYLTPDHSGIQLNDVCVFTRPDLNPECMILKHVNAHANRSDIIGMVGRTGAGKTTLLSVLQNTAGNRTGHVMLDSKDLNDIPKTVLRQIIGVLPQLPFVFKGWTIRRFLDPRRLFTDDDINLALDQCGLLRFVNDLPGGKSLDTVIIPEFLGLGSLRANVSGSRSFSQYGSGSYSSGSFSATSYSVADIAGGDYTSHHASTDLPTANQSPDSETLDSTNKHDSQPSKTLKKDGSFDLSKPVYDSDMLLSNTQLRTLWFARLVLYRHFYRIIVVDEPPEEDLVDENTGRNDDLGVPIYELLKKYFSHCTTFVTAHDANVLQICSSVWVIHDGCLIRTCRTSDIAANESIANIIEESVKYTK